MARRANGMLSAPKIKFTCHSSQRALPTEETIVYFLTEGLYEVSGFTQVHNSGTYSQEGILYEADGVTPFVPTLAEYPYDGTIDLSGGRYIDTQVILPQDRPWKVQQNYDTVMGVSYKSIILDYLGNGTAHIWRSVNGEQFTLVEADMFITYTPPLETFKIYEGIDNIINPVLITISPITDDNIIDATEALGNIIVSGVVQAPIQIGEIVTITLDGVSSTTTVQADLTYSLTYLGSDLVNAVVKTIDVSVPYVDSNLVTQIATGSRTYIISILEPDVGVDYYITSDGSHYVTSAGTYYVPPLLPPDGEVATITATTVIYSDTIII